MATAPTPAPARPRGVLHLDRDAFAAEVRGAGGDAGHAAAIRATVLARGAEVLHATMTPRRHLPAALLAHLEARGFVPTPATLVTETRSADGSVKLALALADGAVIETVVMPGRRSGSVCLSSQVGCPVGCPFCASGIGGLVRNLTPGEILDQVVWARRVGAFARLVFMGIGEPLLNLPGLGAALAVLEEEGSWPPWRVTLSTVGWPEALRRLAERRTGHRLAVSLHAADDATRARLVPAMAGVPVAEVVAAARHYWRQNGERVQFEFVVLAGVNDQLGQVERLAELCRGMDAYLNLIPWNPVPDLPFGRPTEERLHALIRRGRERGLFTTCRRSMGQDSAAACGQLRRGLRAAEAPA